MTPTKKVTEKTRRLAIELCSVAACEGVSLAQAFLVSSGSAPANLNGQLGDVWRLCQRARGRAYEFYREDMDMDDVDYHDTVLEAEMMLREGWQP